MIYIQGKLRRRPPQRLSAFFKAFSELYELYRDTVWMIEQSKTAPDDESAAEYRESIGANIDRLERASFEKLCAIFKKRIGELRDRSELTGRSRAKRRKKTRK